jgi:hypothetical protein
MSTCIKILIVVINGQFIIITNSTMEAIIEEVVKDRSFKEFSLDIIITLLNKLI